MAAEPKRRGRPWASIEHLDVATAELVNLLRELIDGSDGGLRGLSRRLAPSHFNGASPPGYNTLSARLKGEGLRNDGSLVAAIVQVCARPEQVAELSAHTKELLAAARAAAWNDGTTKESAGSATDRELVAAQRRIIELQDELAEALRRAADSERELRRVQAQLTTQSDTPPSRVASEQSPTVIRPRDETNVPETFGGTTDQAQEAKPGAETRSRRSDDAPFTGQKPPHEARSSTDESDIGHVLTALRAADPDGSVTGQALRDAYDLVLDGARTGRYRWDTLTKSERLVMGTKVEHALRAAWDLGRGEDADFSIVGMDVNLIFSVKGRWIVGPEHIGKMCLLVSADDEASRWSVGLTRITKDHVMAASNRDGRRPMTAAARRTIRWIFQDEQLPTNALLHLPDKIVAEVLSHRTGQARVDALFRSSQGQLIGRNAVSTVAMQFDGAKRVRDARRRLREEGIMILGYRDAESAGTLGLPVPRGTNQWISARLIRPQDGSDAPWIEIGGERWTLAEPDDEVEALPQL
ncbi:NaeI family type II restriction endonuclease [Streptomyces anulatus]|uniref:NaeI family type II restriction endonuclease n=1 Tax=Streptomyces anulatus TaxID=1892 RepID=UPI0036ACD493